MKNKMITWQDARKQVLAGITPLSAVQVPITQAAGRILALDLVAQRTQPPSDVSAMDGYAVRTSDNSPYKVVGEAAAGHAYEHPLQKGEAVRIFTGAALPENADAIIIQEDVTREGDMITAPKPSQYKYVRKVGIDFKAGESVIEKFIKLTPQVLGLAAAFNYGQVPVTKAPRVAILSTGDELKEAGFAGEQDIVSTNALVLAQIVKDAGGRVTDHGIAPDKIITLRHKLYKIMESEPDILITSGGASVGDHDLVQQVLKEMGMSLGFWKIAMRPGKPLIHGRLHKTHILGLPGNPVSSFVCGQIFVKPLIEALTGLTTELEFHEAKLTKPLRANDNRAEFIRAHVKGEQITPFDNQDSSLLTVLSKANALIYREIEDDEKLTNELVKYILI